MPENKRRNRIVIETPATRNQHGARQTGRQTSVGSREWIAAFTVIGAAALATFIALFLTSRPYNPMTSTLDPVQTVPAGSLALQPSPKPSPAISPSPQTNQTASIAPTSEPSSNTETVPDDAGIQFQIDRALAADPTLSKLDVSTLVQSGKVTVVGSVRSAELKQRVEQLLRTVKGVNSVDNQLVITEATP